LNDGQCFGGDPNVVGSFVAIWCRQVSLDASL
jgi:hypothetical protein